jgi:hypothetical protein
VAAGAFATRRKSRATVSRAKCSEHATSAHAIGDADPQVLMLRTRKQLMRRSGAEGVVQTSLRRMGAISMGGTR